MHRLRIRERLLSITTLESKRLSSTSKTFVSEHYSPDAEDMKKVVAAMDSDTRLQNDGVLSVKVCRLCTKGNKDDMGNLWKLLIRKDGSFHCYRCTQGMGTISRNHMIFRRVLILCHFHLVWRYLRHDLLQYEIHIYNNEHPRWKLDRFKEEDFRNWWSRPATLCQGFFRVGCKQFDCKSQKLSPCCDAYHLSLV